ncbi:MAG: ATPase, T2SS/T4P/T4SS family [Thermoguttaceae bacterium]|nr:ATPase, T2SS/T4P/T4SS family [Thermoguttaceae bacterium]
MALLVSMAANQALAANWPAYRPDPGAPNSFRGPGHYLSAVRVLLPWFVFLLWVWTTDWVSRDVQEVKLKWNYLRWNPIVFGSFMAGFVLLWMIPYFWLGFVLLLISYAGPLATYIVIRNSQVSNDLRVLTREHLRYVLASKMQMLGVKMQAEAQDPHRAGPPVALTARGGADDRENNARLLASRQAPGLRTAREIIANGLQCRAASILLDFTQQAVGVRYLIDGVWHQRESEEREKADLGLEALKILCGLNPQDRQGRQEGAFGAEYQTIRYEGTFASQGTKTGERVVLQFEDPKVRFTTLDDLGMRAKMQEQLKELMNGERGFVVLSAMPGGGLRSTVNVLLHALDRFTREFVAVEEATKRYEEVENIPVTVYNAAEGQSTTDVLVKLFRMDPHVIVFRDLPDGETVDVLCGEILEENRIAVSTMRAKDAAEALVRVLALGAKPVEFAKVASAAMGQRLIRKLCDACKEAYTPTPEVLKQLGLPEGRVQAFHRPPQQPEEVCKECGGIGYVGRTALFELLVVGDSVRKALAARAKPDLLRQAARKDGMRSLQEEGLLLVAKGVTSLPELMRVLKQ